MATLEVKVVRVLRVLQTEIQGRLGELDERQIATVTWSFGSLKHNPGALLDLLAEVATPRLDSFELQVQAILCNNWLIICCKSKFEDCIFLLSNVFLRYFIWPSLYLSIAYIDLNKLI